MNKLKRVMNPASSKVVYLNTTEICFRSGDVTEVSELERGKWPDLRHVAYVSGFETKTGKPLACLTTLRKRVKK